MKCLDETLCYLRQDKCCNECMDYKKCIKNNVDFKNPPEEYPECWICIYLNNDECTTG